MDEEILRKILIARAKAQNKKAFTVSVSGSSMEPVLYEGEHVEVLPQVAYEVGDILVYYYKQEGLLVHRLLKIQDNRYFCKGDNALRLEDVEREAIVGAVQLEQDPHRTR
ncbi:MAG: S24/S26 family peptidase, partial [Bianqueaceae bacterium]